VISIFRLLKRRCSAC